LELAFSDEAKLLSSLMDARIEILRMVFGSVGFCVEDDMAVKHESGKRVTLQTDRIDSVELRGVCDSVELVVWW
jgi:hypothetical protein